MLYKKIENNECDVFNLASLPDSILASKSMIIASSFSAFISISASLKPCPKKMQFGVVLFS